MKYPVDQLKKLGPPITIRKAGSEEIHICPSCGKPKLHINKRKKVWYCFYEGTGGILPPVVAPSTEFKAPILEEAQEDISLPEPCESLRAARGIMAQIYEEYLQERGLADWQIIGHGRITTDPKYWGRVILASPNGYWVARKVVGDGPPYMNPPGKKLPWIARVRGESPNLGVVLEGVFDALAVARAGFKAYALLGNEVYPEAQRILLRSESRVIILLDSHTFSESWEAFMRLGSQIPTKLLFTDEAFPGYEDPADVPTDLLRDKLGEV